MRFLGMVAFAALLVTPAAPVLAEPQQQDITTCRAYGFRPGTDNFALCLMQIDQQRQADQKQRLRAFGQALGAFGAALSQQQRQQMNCTTQNLGGGMVTTHCY